MRKTSLILILGALLLCAACGKRPDVVDAPEGTNPNVFPKTYPDVSTDPKGYAHP